MMDAQLRQRLLRARRTVEEAAAEALKSAEIDETVIAASASNSAPPQHDKQANINSQKILSSKAAGGCNAENDHPNLAAAAAAATDADGNDNEYEAYERERASSSAAFQLGMTLFGDDVSAIERTVVDALGQVEDELHTLLGDIRRRSGASSSADVGKLVQIAEEDGDGGGGGDADDNMIMATMSMDEAAMEMQAKALAAKAAFLKKCSAARMYLDQEERMALELLSTPLSHHPVLLLLMRRLLAAAAVAEVQLLILVRRRHWWNLRNCCPGRNRL